MADGDDGFITLPPGLFDPATLQASPRPERARPPADDIVFVPTVPGMAPPPPPAARPVMADSPEETTITSSRPAPRPWTLQLPDGTRATVAHVVVLGRNPVAQAAWPDAELLPLADTTHSVSKTHAALEVDESGLWVHDLGSTNGVWVVSGNDVTEAVPGRRVRVPEGASIELGELVLTAREG